MEVTEICRIFRCFDVLTIALAVVGANASVAMLVIFGITPIWYGIWDKAGISDLGKLVFNVSMPALVFPKMLYQIFEVFLHSTCST
jgi:hypothetical protein